MNTLARVNNLIVLASYLTDMHIHNRSKFKLPEKEFNVLIRSLLCTCSEIIRAESARGKNN